MNKPKYRVGQKVRYIGCTKKCGEGHSIMRHHVGMILVIGKIKVVDAGANRYELMDGPSNANEKHIEPANEGIRISYA